MSVKTESSTVLAFQTESDSLVLRLRQVDRTEHTKVYMSRATAGSFQTFDLSAYEAAKLAEWLGELPEVREWLNTFAQTKEAVEV